MSELVANALLHGTPPFILRLRGTSEHPRFEVLDGSPVPPHQAVAFAAEELRTTGRGLSLVSMAAERWGAQPLEGGKMVWLEPSRHLGQETAEGSIFEPLAPRGSAVDGHVVSIRLIGVPLPRLADIRRHYHELRRELALLALNHGDSYPLATSLVDLYTEFESYIASDLVAAAVEAAMAGRDFIEFDMVANERAPEVFAALKELLDLADEFCRSERLLSLARTPEQAVLQQWMYDEVVRQMRGHPPERFPGDERITTHS